MPHIPEIEVAPEGAFLFLPFSFAVVLGLFCNLGQTGLALFSGKWALDFLVLVEIGTQLPELFAEQGKGPVQFMPSSFSPMRWSLFDWSGRVFFLDFLLECGQQFGVLGL